MFRQTVEVPEIDGKGCTVMVEVLEQPILLVSVIVVVPSDKPTTSPVFETVATAVLLDVHGLVVAAVPLPVNCNLEFKQTEETPEIVGSGFTVMVMVVVFAHCPAVGVNVYVVVATLFKAGDHVPLIELLEVVGSADKLASEQIADTWVNVGVTGLLTVIVVVFEHPLLFV